jgi:hypothetical protein
MDEAAAEVSRLEAAELAREAFDGHEAWRYDRLVEIDDGLEHHWAGVVLSAVREGDPMAYGEERLRHARSTYAADLSRVKHDDERKRHGLGCEYEASSQATMGSGGSAGQAELSVVVAELDEAIEACEPSPLQRSLVARPAADRTRDLDGLSRPPLHRDHGHGLGLGR